jgi:hypothetical protein
MLAIYYRGPAFHVCGLSQARTFCCIAIPGRRRSQQGQHCALSLSDHAGSCEANAANWRVEFNGTKSGRRWHQGRATVREHTPHANEHTSNVSRHTPSLNGTTRTVTIINAPKRRALAVLNDESLDAQSRAIIRYGLETNERQLWAR